MLAEVRDSMTIEGTAAVRMSRETASRTRNLEKRTSTSRVTARAGAERESGEGNIGTTDSAKAKRVRLGTVGNLPAACRIIII
jgi:hypothetical protein